MAGNLRWVLVALLALHGLVHFLGAAKGSIVGTADVDRLELGLLDLVLAPPVGEAIIT